MRRGNRLLLQILLLPALYGLSLVDSNFFQLAVSIALLILFPVSWAVAWLLVWAARQAPEIRSLTEAADNAITTALQLTALAFVALIAVLRITGVITQPVGSTWLVLLSYALVLFGAPTIGWLRTLRDVWLPMIRRKP